VIRRNLRSEDRDSLQELLEDTGFFNSEELQVAMELVDDRLQHGENSHYRFLVASSGRKLRGYACWGPIPGTVSSVDLYWIAVHPEGQGQGTGRALLLEAEAWILEEGRNRVYVETSSRPQYGPTRAFYRACGYIEDARLDEFYAPNEAKVIFLKVLHEPTSSPESDDTPSDETSNFESR